MYTKTITYFISQPDETQFTDELKCISHEKLYNSLLTIMKKLPECPDTINFSNGHGYIQHDWDNVDSVVKEFLELLQPIVKVSCISDTIEEGIQKCHPSWAGRMIGEYFPNAISKLWWRFECIDKLGREFGQPYYSNEKTQQDDWFLENSLVRLN